MSNHLAARKVLAPLHGMLAAFPLALFTSALASDIAYANSANQQWANFSIWLIAGGLAMAMLATLIGIIDAIALRDRTRRRSPFHTILTLAMLLTALINAFVHSRDGWTSVVPTGLALSVVTVALVLVTSWLGYSITLPSSEQRV